MGGELETKPQKKEDAKVQTKSDPSLPIQKKTTSKPVKGKKRWNLFKRKKASGPVEVEPSDVEFGNQNIRTHINTLKGGRKELHFHADDEGLKVAVPLAEWYVAWNAMKNMRITEWSYLDRERGTSVIIEIGQNNKGELDASITVFQEFQTPVKLGKVFSELDKYAAKGFK